MPVNELNLPPPAREKSFFDNRPHGIPVMIGAPMLSIFFMFGNLDADATKTLEEHLMLS